MMAPGSIGGGGTRLGDFVADRDLDAIVNAMLARHAPRPTPAARAIVDALPRLPVPGDLSVAGAARGAAAVAKGKGDDKGRKLAETGGKLDETGGKLVENAEDKPARPTGDEGSKLAEVRESKSAEAGRKLLADKDKLAAPGRDESSKLKEAEGEPAEAGRKLIADGQDEPAAHGGDGARTAKLSEACCDVMPTGAHAAAHAASAESACAAAAGTALHGDGRRRFARCAPGDACPVCADGFVGGETVVEMPCLHCFHDGCLLPWLKDHNTCPVCRHQLEVEQSLPEAAEALPGDGGGVEAATDDGWLQVLFTPQLRQQQQQPQQLRLLEDMSDVLLSWLPLPPHGSSDSERPAADAVPPHAPQQHVLPRSMAPNAATAERRERAAASAERASQRQRRRLADAAERTQEQLRAAQEDARERLPEILRMQQQQQLEADGSTGHAVATPLLALTEKLARAEAAAASAMRALRRFDEMLAARPAWARPSQTSPRAVADAPTASDSAASNSAASDSAASHSAAPRSTSPMSTEVASAAPAGAVPAVAAGGSASLGGGQTAGNAGSTSVAGAESDSDVVAARAVRESGGDDRDVNLLFPLGLLMGTAGAEGDATELMQMAGAEADATELMHMAGAESDAAELTAEAVDAVSVADAALDAELDAELGVDTTRRGAGPEDGGSAAVVSRIDAQALGMGLPRPPPALRPATVLGVPLGSLLGLAGLPLRVVEFVARRAARWLRRWDGGRARGGSGASRADAGMGAPAPA